jgi:plastocyanin
MGILDFSVFGTPKEHASEKKEIEVVKAPEFDATQYAKKLGVIVGVVTGATAAALKLFNVSDVSSGMVIGALGVTAAALLGVCLVTAVDIASRAYLTGTEAGEKAAAAKEGGDAGSGPSSMSAAPPGTVAWLQDDDRPHPVLAIAGDGGKNSSYLIASGASVEHPVGKENVKAIDGAPQWHPAAEVRSLKPSKWP